MTTWNIDTMHSEIGFKVKHLMISTVRGRFDDFAGTLKMEGEDFTNAEVEFTAQTASVDTKSEMRDGHLKSPEFFDTEKFPTLTFKSTSISKESDKGYAVKGDLTMHGVTKEVVLDTTFNGSTVGIDGSKVLSFEIAGTLSRADFDLTWNKALETGGVAVSDEVKLDIEAEFKEAK